MNRENLSIAFKAHPHPVYWTDDGATLHGPFDHHLAACEDAAHETKGESVTIGAVVNARPFTAAIFELIDELFDQKNDDPASPDDPPSCSWRPEHVDELKNRLGETLGVWMEQHGYNIRQPRRADLVDCREFTRAELAAVARAIAA